MSKRQLKAKNTGSIGMDILSILFSRMGCSLHPTGSGEVGIDGFVELFDANRQSIGKIFALQSKCTESLDLNDPHSFSFRLKNKDLRYWHKLNIPAVIFFTNPEETKEAYYIPAESVQISNPKSKTTTILGNRLRLLDEKALKTFSVLAKSPKEFITSIPGITKTLASLLDNIDPYFHPEIRFEKDKTVYYTVPKTPDAFEKNPQVFKGTIDLSDPKIREQMKRHEERGDGFEIESRHITFNEIPSMMEKLGATAEEIQSFIVAPAYKKDQKFYFELRLKTVRRSRKQTIPLVFNIVKRGTKEITFSNLEEKRPFVIELRLSLEGGNGTITIQFKPSGHDVIEVERAINDLLKLVGSEEITVYDSVRQAKLVRLRMAKMDDFANKLSYEQSLSKCLRKIEVTVGQNIKYPKGKMSNEDVESIIEIYKAFTSGIVHVKPDQFQFAATRSQALELIEGAKVGNGIRSVRKLDPDMFKITLFGHTYPFKFKSVFEFVELAQIDHVAAEKVIENQQADMLELPITDIPETRIMNVFTEWLSPKDRRTFSQIRRELLP